MQEADRPRLVIADGTPLVVQALADLFGRSGRFSAIESGTTGQTVLKALGDGAADVALVGWRLADMSAADVLRSLKIIHAPMRVTVLGSEVNQSVLRRAVALGAMGFCWQSDDPAVLIDTVLSVSRNRLSLPFIDVSRVEQSPLESLTPRERDLLKALSDGWSNIQIASRFGISENTVKYHLKNVYDKLGVKNRAMAITLFVSEDRHNG